MFNNHVFAMVTIGENSPDKVVLKGPELTQDLLEEIARSLSACMLPEAERPPRLERHVNATGGT